MASVRGRVLSASQSNELREVFRQLADIEGPAGAKFTRRVLTALAARIVGRAYEMPLLELCHLVRAAQLADKGKRGGGFEWLFWGVDVARPSAYRAAFGECGEGTEEDGVPLRYPDGGFDVRFGRMPMLTALMEFLVSFLGYRTVVDAATRLRAEDASRQTVSSVAKDLARQLYSALRDHLPTAQAQRKFLAMIEFLQEEAGDEFTGHDIDDQAVLNFWLASAACERADFRGFRTTTLAFLHLRRLLLESDDLHALAHPLIIGGDNDAGEVELSAEAVLPSLPDDDPLEMLQEQPAASVKAYNKRELAALELPLTETAGVVALRLSYLRAETFGALQNRLTQALRRRSGDVAALIAAGPSTSYADCVAALARLAQHTRQVMQATLYVLRHRKEEDARAVEDLTTFAAQRKAFNAINRAGFDRHAVEDPRRPAFETLADALTPISEALAAVLDAFENDAWRARESSDRLQFEAAFNRLYGVEEDA